MDEHDDRHPIPFPLRTDAKNIRSVENALKRIFPDQAATLRENILEYVKRYRAQRKKWRKEFARFRGDFARHTWPIFSNGHIAGETLFKVLTPDAKSRERWEQNLRRARMAVGDLRVPPARRSGSSRSSGSVPRTGRHGPLSGRAGSGDSPGSLTAAGNAGPRTRADTREALSERIRKGLGRDKNHTSAAEETWTKFRARGTGCLGTGAETAEGGKDGRSLREGAVHRVDAVSWMIEMPPDGRLAVLLPQDPGAGRPVDAAAKRSFNMTPGATAASWPAAPLPVQTAMAG